MSDVAAVSEALKKSGVLWLDVPGGAQPRAAWYLWKDGAAYLVTGGEPEQPLHGLPEAAAAGEPVNVTVRAKDGGRGIGFTAAVTEVEPGGAEWDEVVPLLAKERLNARDHQGQPDRWADEAYVMRLTPLDGAEIPAGYATVRPPGSPATTGDRAPYMRGARGRRADR